MSTRTELVIGRPALNQSAAPLQKYRPRPLLGHRSAPSGPKRYRSTTSCDTKRSRLSGRVYRATAVARNAYRARNQPGARHRELQSAKEPRSSVRLFCASLLCRSAKAGTWRPLRRRALRRRSTIRWPRRRRSSACRLFEPTGRTRQVAWGRRQHIRCSLPRERATLPRSLASGVCSNRFSMKIHEA